MVYHPCKIQQSSKMIVFSRKNLWPAGRNWFDPELFTCFHEISVKFRQKTTSSLISRNWQELFSSFSTILRKIIRFLEILQHHFKNSRQSPLVQRVTELRSCYLRLLGDFLQEPILSFFRHHFHGNNRWVWFLTDFSSWKFLFCLFVLIFGGTLLIAGNATFWRRNR